MATMRGWRVIYGTSAGNMQVKKKTKYEKFVESMELEDVEEAYWDIEWNDVNY